MAANTLHNFSNLICDYFIFKNCTCNTQDEMMRDLWLPSDWNRESTLHFLPTVEVGSHRLGAGQAWDTAASPKTDLILLYVWFLRFIDSHVPVTISIFSSTLPQHKGSLSRSKNPLNFLNMNCWTIWISQWATSSFERNKETKGLSKP